MPDVAELGRRVKAKYPGQYDDLGDADLGSKVKAKHPEYSDFTDMPKGNDGAAAQAYSLPGIPNPPLPPALRPTSDSDRDAAIQKYSAFYPGSEMAGLSSYGRRPVKDVIEGSQQAISGQTLDDKAGGASRVLSGAGKLALPFVAGPAISAPVATVVGAAPAYIAGKGVRAGLKALGAGKGVQDLGEDVGNAAGGVAMAKLATSGPASAVKDFLGSQVSQLKKLAAKKFYQSALKPGVADAETLADVRGAVQTGLENEIPVSEAGAQKLEKLVQDYQKQVNGAVQAASDQGRTVPRADVARRGDIVAHDLSLQADPRADVKASLATIKKFNKSHPEQMNPNYAQAVKVGTYKKTYDRNIGTAQIETEKALARGIKEELEGIAPELRDLNAKEGSLLSLQGPLERAIRRAGNADVTDFGDAALATGAATVAPLAAPALFVRKVLGIPEVKSRLAVSLWTSAGKTSKPITMKAARVRAGAIIGQLAGEDSDQEKK